MAGRYWWGVGVCMLLCCLGLNLSCFVMLEGGASILNGNLGIDFGG